MGDEMGETHVGNKASPGSSDEQKERTSSTKYQGTEFDNAVKGSYPTNK